jgi:hypothetical protein
MFGTLRSDASRIVQLRTDGTGISPWAILDDRVQWWQVIGVSNNATYNIQIRPAQTGITCTTQVVALNACRSDLFVGCPDLQVRIQGGQPNTLYLLAVQGANLSSGD